MTRLLPSVLTNPWPSSLLVSCLRLSTSSPSQSSARYSHKHGINKLARSSSPDLATSRCGLDPASNRFHAPMVYHEQYSFPGWPESHTFPMDKFTDLAHTLTNTCKATNPGSSSLSRPLVRSLDDFYRPFDMTQILEGTSWFEPPIIDEGYWHRFKTGTLSKEECRAIGFREQTSRPELIRRTILEVAGTILTCQLAQRHGLATNLAGGTHHAHPKGGAGFTILNDLAIATHVLTKEKEKNKTATPFIDQQDAIDRVLVVDCDVHQGDGTAKYGSLEILRDRLYTLSIHCESNYPFCKSQSTMDVALPDGTGDDEYMEYVSNSVKDMIGRISPDLILYDAGVDVHISDRLGRLNLSDEGIRRRDRWILDHCVTNGIPVAAVIGGGYDKDRQVLAHRHSIVHEQAAYVWRKHKMWKRR